MLLEKYNETPITNFQIEDSNNVQLIDVIVVDDNLWGRFDIIINKYYQGKFEYLPTLLSFNKITDPLFINIGSIIELPNIMSLENYIKINTVLDDDNVPGISKSTNNDIVNQELTKETTNNNKTTALPKLNITVEKVKYNAETGILKF